MGIVFVNLLLLESQQEEHQALYVLLVPENLMALFVCCFEENYWQWSDK